MVRNNKAVIASMNEAWNARDWTAYGSAFADVVKWSRLPARRDVTRAEYVAIIQGIVQTFPDWRVTDDRLIAEGDWVAQRSRMSGTHLARATSPHHGDLRNFEPTGKSIEVWQAHFRRLADGVITEHEAVRDDLGIFQQLGLR